MGLRFGTFLCSLIFCTSLSAQSTSPAPRWIPVKDISELQQGNVVIIMDENTQYVATDSITNKQTDERCLEITDCNFNNGQIQILNKNKHLAELIINKVNGEGDQYWRLSLKNPNSETTNNRYGLIGYNSSKGTYMFTCNNGGLQVNFKTGSISDVDPQNYYKTILSNNDGKLNIRFADKNNNITDGYLGMRKYNKIHILDINNEENSLPVKLYRKDMYNLQSFKEGNKIIVRWNVYPDDRGAYWYAITNKFEGKWPNSEELYIERFPSSFNNDPEAGEVEINLPDYEDGKITLWFVKEHSSAGSEAVDIFTVTYHEEEGDAIIPGWDFKHPDVKQISPGKINFEEKPGVEIFYTLDDTEPMIDNVRYKSRALDNEIVENDSDVPQGTFSHTDTPLMYDGKTLNVKYKATKKGFYPTDTYQITIEGTTSIIETVAEAQDAAPIYFDLLGRSVAMPTMPGIYIRKQGKNTEKIIIR